jgi:hypothetical protein
MLSITHAVGFIVTAAIVALAFIFAFVDLAARLEFMQQKLPWLQRWLERRSSVVYLLIIAIYLQVLFLAELKRKEVPPVPIFSPYFRSIPAPIIEEPDRPGEVPPSWVREPTVHVLQRKPSVSRQSREY